MAEVAYAPARGLGERTSAVRAVGVLKSKIESLNRLGNLISEDVESIRQELDRLVGCQPFDPTKAIAAAPVQNDMDAMQEQLDRLDRLAQFVHGQLDRLRAI